MAAVLPPNTNWPPHSHPSLHRRTQSHSSSVVSFQEKVDQHDTEQLPVLSHSIKIKPYLRKLSLRDNNSNNLDLSRPTAENESLAGLGYYDESRSGSELAFTPIVTTASRSRHQRSASNTSTFSTSSSQRPSVPTPFKHTPRPYTPPIAATRSYTASSLLSSSDSVEAEDIMADEDFRFRQRAFEHTTRRSGSIGSLPAVPQTIHMHSSSSLTRLNGSNISQSSLPSVPTSRSRGDTMRSVDSSRGSMDKAMHIFRGGKDEPLDPATRAANIMAARIAYAEREEAKERKAEKEYLRQQNRRRNHERPPRGRSESATTGSSSQNEKMQFVGKSYDEYTPAHSRTLPKHVPTTTTSAATNVQNIRSGRSAQPGKSKTLKSRWLGFMAWLKTRLLRLGKKMSGGR
ncbi:hypothetical protein BT63DRAFT_98938 [Microthyrium microscopicum]|uniref:Uncharacterized protein n=1 Tax=Microthyrium microscopicum TaxID=703497 RepID=A0A6A6TW31_9PEZI|nr:hypothetical protein BT63DRAFT_98938 [Microthyrium microscopicum]